MKVRKYALMAACAGVVGFGTLAPAAVVINEVQYDDGGAADDREFVELYNNGTAAVDIGGWVLDGQDVGTARNPSFTIPAGTMLAAGDYYVLGNTGVLNVDQVIGANSLENAAETVELRSSAAAGSVLQDAVLYASFNGAATASNGYGTLPAAVATEVGGGTNSPGYWGRFQSQDVAGTPLNTLSSLGRYLDGRDTNNNGRDFGLRPSTPGTSNLGGGSITAAYTPADVDALAVSAEVPGLRGAFGNARVINPAVVSTYNPSAIPASPQGGNVISVIDTTGGGNAAVGLDVHQGAGSFLIDAYLDTVDFTNSVWHETTTYGTMGQVDAFANLPDIDGDILSTGIPTSAGVTGVAWIYQKFGSRAKLYLVDAGDGGNSSPDVPPVEWSVLGTFDLSSDPSAWHRLGITVNPDGSGVAIFDGNLVNFTTAPNLVGEFYVGYREGLGAGTPGAPGAGEVYNPARFDIVPEPASLSLLALGGLALARRRRA